MRSAPPVLVPVGRFVWSASLAGVLAAATALIGLLTAWWCGMTLARAVFMGAVWVLAAGVTWWALQREILPPGELSWDGQSWWYRAGDGQGAAVAVTLTLRWDAGRAMLLQLDLRKLGELPRHAWLKASQMPAQWHGLRCAVHAGDTL